MDEQDDWSIVDKASLDPEVILQIEFLSWLNEHPDASREGEPVLNFGEGLQIHLGGHCWHLRTTSKSVTVVGRTGGWKGQRLSFAVYRVEPIDGGRISSEYHVEEEVRSVCGLRWQNPVGFPKICQDDPSNHLLQQQSVDPEFRSEIRCKFFICLETIGAADSFDEVLDAMYEFSACYALSLREMQSTQIIEYDPFSAKELELWNRIRYLKLQAKDASLMCRTALEAQQAVSKAAATMLENCCSQSTIAMPFWEEESGNQAALSWADGFKRSQAVREGFVLQWCRVDHELDGSSSCIDCELDVGELLVEEAKAEAAGWVGVVKDKPLRIRIDAVTKSVKISQEQFQGRKNVGTDFLLPQVVEKHIVQLWDQPYETLNNNNVLVAVLHEVASYLSNLSSICVVCSESLHRSLATQEVRFPRLCAQPICEANFDCWTSASVCDFEFTGFKENLAPYRSSAVSFFIEP